jgi:hypothetical protein
VTGVSRLQQLRDRDLAGATAQRLDAGDRLVDFVLPVVLFGHDPGNGTVVPDDEYGLSVFDVVEQLGKVDLGVLCLDFTHCGGSSSIGLINWSKY